uniref:(northern house mosquito) hypothetical protein n=1 Tax=Culex pipiens TaxID=7175 RepID=A0A8D8H5R5_CULPI
MIKKNKCAVFKNDLRGAIFPTSEPSLLLLGISRGSCIRRGHKRPLQFVLPRLAVLCRHLLRKLRNQRHRLLRIPTTEELDVGKNLRQANQLVLVESVLVALHKHPPQLPVLVALVKGLVLFHVEGGFVGHFLGSWREGA